MFLDFTGSDRRIAKDGYTKMWKLTRLLSLGAFCACCIARQGVAAEESWYVFFSVGSAPVFSRSYSVGESAKGLEVVLPFLRPNIDLLGIYLPVHKYKLLFGPVLNSIGDCTTNESNCAGSRMLALSGWKFFGQETGDGLFLRADVGPADVRRGSETNASTGFGLQVGTGVALPMSDEWRFIVGVNYFLRSSSTTTFQGASVSFGGMF
jgi:hypothetical protein